MSRLTCTVHFSSQKSSTKVLHLGNPGQNIRPWWSSKRHWDAVFSHGQLQPVLPARCKPPAPRSPQLPGAPPPSCDQRVGRWWPFPQGFRGRVAHTRLGEKPWEGKAPGWLAGLHRALCGGTTLLWVNWLIVNEGSWTMLFPMLFRGFQGAPLCCIQGCPSCIFLMPRG